MQLMKKCAKQLHETIRKKSGILQRTVAWARMLWTTFIPITRLKKVILPHAKLILILWTIIAISISFHTIKNIGVKPKSISSFLTKNYQLWKRNKDKFPKLSFEPMERNEAMRRKSLQVPYKLKKLQKKVGAEKGVLNINSAHRFAKVKVLTDKEKKLLNSLSSPIGLAPRKNFLVHEISYSIMSDGVRQPLLKDQPVILVWWPPAYLEREKEKTLERNFQSFCGKCRLTTDRSTLKRSAIVIFDNNPQLYNLADLPPANFRHNDQAYILWDREPPVKNFHLKENMHGTFDTMFNYTLSYRRNADITWYLGNAEYAQRYGLARQRIQVQQRQKPQQEINDVIKSKRHLAVWIVSNCNYTRGAVERMDYVNKLIAAGLDVHLFGKCYNREVPKSLDQFLPLLRPYKFFLAFENSWHCKDYITEKFWRNGLMANLVPVVWGPTKQDVDAVAPKHSYVHAEDFKSPVKLVNYLNYLDRNQTAYEEYFNWRKDGIQEDLPTCVFRPGYEMAMCKMCSVLTRNGGKMPHRVLKSSIDWLFGKMTEGKCVE